MRFSLVLLACLLAAPVAVAQTAPPRPYLHTGAGVGVLPNRLDDGTREVVQNATGWSGVVEAGLTRGHSALGLRIEAYRARRGDESDLRSLLPTNDWYDAAQVNALVVSRRAFPVGPLEVSAGTGAGLGYNVSVVQEAPTSGVVRDGQVVSSIPTTRAARVLPLLHLDATVGRTVGRTFVGLGAGTSSVLGDDVVARYGVEVRRTF